MSIVFQSFNTGVANGEPQTNVNDYEYEDWRDDYDDDIESEGSQSDRDRLYYWNYSIFQLNDRLYIFLLRPVARGYGKSVPEPARIAIKNFFTNLSTPVRLTNCILQRKFKGAYGELKAFVINSTIGVFGFGNPSISKYQIDYEMEDLGQTFATFGIGRGYYVVLPLIGPSSIRDSFGLVGDSFLNPTRYLPIAWNITFFAIKQINGNSLRLGEYERIKNAAFSPYEAFRDAYFQYREHQIAK